LILIIIYGIIINKVIAMYRKFYQELEIWDKAQDKLPLMVIGARQVGKTFIINQYCKEHYKDYIYINLMEEKNYVSLFKEKISFGEKLELLEARLGKSLSKEDTIIFFDEIQESEELIEALKFFAESDKSYNIVCAGSLLGVKLKRLNCSFPVGKVDMKLLYPMDFEEFLIAIDKKDYINIIKRSFKSNTPLTNDYHDELLRLLYRYLYLGGMPGVINNYIMNNCDLAKTNANIIKNITISYFNDMSKYNLNKKESIRIERIYANIPSQLAKENQKFVFASIDKKDNRKRDYVTALDWLLASKLVLSSYQVKKIELPLKGFIDNDNYKLYLSDTGIMCNILEIPSYEILTNGDYSYKGVIIENYIACELEKMGYSLYYWSRQGKNKGVSELDFILQVDSDIVPIEVKAGVKVQAKSLEIYKEFYNPKYGIRVSAKNFGFENNIKSVPLYAVFCLNELNRKEEIK